MHIFLLFEIEFRVQIYGVRFSSKLIGIVRAYTFFNIQRFDYPCLLLFINLKM